MTGLKSIRKDFPKLKIYTKSESMARPIKETPTLYGREAQRIIDMIDNPRPVTQEEVQRAQRVYDAVIAKINFEF